MRSKDYQYNMGYSVLAIRTLGQAAVHLQPLVSEEHSRVFLLLKAPRKTQQRLLRVPAHAELGTHITRSVLGYTMYS